MDKLSLYEILSFVIPGFILVFITNLYTDCVFNLSNFLDTTNDISESLLLFVVSLFFGIVIHIITFRFLKTSRLKWYKKLIFKSVQAISADNAFIQRVIPFLNDEYKKVRKHHEEPVNETEAEANLFDFAYLYLEVNDKITPAKNFQSMYFWFRNMFTMSIILVPISILLYGITFYMDLSHGQKNYALWIIIINIILGIVIIPTANWLREKLIEKVLWSYYVERVHENEKLNKK
jgi:hypothetical protein